MKEEMSKEKNREKVKEEKAECSDAKCHIHGSLSTRGRSFKGIVRKIYGCTLSIEFERFIYYAKYERYARARTRIHAHIPSCLRDKIKIGSYIVIKECRPLSKTVHHVVTGVEK